MWHNAEDGSHEVRFHFDVGRLRKDAGTGQQGNRGRTGFSTQHTAHRKKERKNQPTKRTCVSYRPRLWQRTWQPAQGVAKDPNGTEKTAFWSPSGIGERRIITIILELDGPPSICTICLRRGYLITKAHQSYQPFGKRFSSCCFTHSVSIEGVRREGDG